MANSLMLCGTILIAATTALAQTTAPNWGQCGGKTWVGPTTCPSGWTCVVSNEHYSQCLQIPGGGSVTTPTTPTTSPGGTAPGSPTTGGTAPGGTTTLAPGYSFIRAVVDPNFHKYLRSEVLGTASDAILGEPGSAAQFLITSGQLIQNVGGKSLYMIVEPLTISAVKLKTMWSASPATAGTFSWSGDTLLWSNPSVPRQATNAWLVCRDTAGNRDLYINLGPYAYNTPAGCADQTIHAYTGTTATA